MDKRDLGLPELGIDLANRLASLSRHARFAEWACLCVMW